MLVQRNKDLFNKHALAAAGRTVLKALADCSTAYPIALDFCDGHLYALQLKGRHQGQSIKGLWHAVLGAAEAAEDGALSGILKEMVRSGRFARKTASLLVPHQDLSIFPLRFQVGKKESIDEAILRESKKYLPYSVEEAVIDYPTIISPQSEEGGGASLYKAIVMSVHREQIKKYVSLLEEAGLIVEAMEAEICSSIRLHEHLFQSPLNPIVLSHIGHRHTFFTIYSHQGILAQRSIPWGFDSLREKLSSNLSISGETKAVALLAQYGLAYKDSENGPAEVSASLEYMNIARTIFQIITPLVDELIYEAHKLISYIRAEEHNPVFDGMYIYGQGALIHRLDRYVENRIGMPVRFSDPFQGMHPEAYGGLNAPESAAFTPALGLALRKTPWL
jgi:type IV pilus assembly protein PilM